MAYTQAGRRLKVTTPLGEDILLLSGFSGHEAISQPFFFQLECVAENENTKKVVFDALLGKKITVEIALPGGAKRFINGICLGSRRARGTPRSRDTSSTSSRSLPAVAEDAEPDLPAHLDSRHPEEGPQGIDVTWEIQGTFEPRDYCVQYRESDFAFASRLMEEEGIYYFFKHSDGSHTMVVANTPGSHPDLPGKSTLIFEAVGGGPARRTASMRGRRPRSCARAR